MNSSESVKPRRAVVTGVANRFSIAWAIARELAGEGYELCLTWPDERIRENLEKLASSLPSAFILPLDAANDESAERFATELGKRWDSLHGLVHSIAYAERDDLADAFYKTSRAGFRIALEISAYSLVGITRPLVPLLAKAGGSVVTLSFLGGQRVIPRYNVMGVAKAALEMAAKYLAADLASRGIRVNVLSPGPVKTAAAKGIRDFGELMKFFLEKTPSGRHIEPAEIARHAAFLLSEKSRGATGQVVFIDGGFSIMG
jgi:enoyl-[acyl-carrier protein] reductase I